ncbi:hypothetical protein BH24ACT21_BH24ACT21_18360 [soil metagenome]
MSGTSKVGKRGAVVIPVELRRRFGIEEGSLVIAEATEDGILIRPAIAVPVETYTAERRAEFLLSNTVDRDDYERAREEVRRMGLDPDAVPHRKPVA